MATVTLQEMLQPQVILKLITRIRPGQGKLGRWLGFQPTRYNPETVALEGPATISGPLQVGTAGNRYVSYRIFNTTRTVPSARAPGTGPGTLIPNPVGVVSVTAARFHDKVPLNYEYLSNLSPMVGPNSQLDPGGQNYIKQQTRYITEKYGKGVEMLAAGMMRDSLYFVPGANQTSLEEWLPQFTAPSSGPYFQVSFQIPSGNKSQLNMLGTGNIIGTSWDNVGAPIIGNLQSIKAAYAQLSGWPMTDVWINSVMWTNIINNTQVRNAAGIAATPFQTFQRGAERGMDGDEMSNEYFAVLAGDPTVRWHICDDILSLGSDIDISYSQSTGTAAKLIPDTMAIFCTQPSSDIAQLYLGGEMVVENPGMPAVMRKGYHFWHEYCTQPSVIELIGLLNAIPCLYVPATFAPSTCVF